MKIPYCASILACAAALAGGNSAEAQIEREGAAFASYGYDVGHSEPGYPAGGAYLPPEYSTEELLWFRGEYLLWRFKDADIPPLVTTGPPSDFFAGVPGRPETRVLFGDELDHDSFNGARFTIGGWFDEHRTFGAEVSWFLFDRGIVEFSASSPGSPVLARPLSNVGSDVPSAIHIASPGRRSGRIDASASSRLLGFEIDGLCDPWYDDPLPDGGDLDLLYGFRYLDLEEELAIGTASRALRNLRGGTRAGFETLTSESFDTRNRFYGGQVGAQWQARRGPFSLRLTGKLALGATHQNVRIEGLSIRSLGRFGQRGSRGAHLAQPTNIGEYSRDSFSVVPELGAHVGYELLAGLSLYAGYTFIYWTNVARPGDQIDETINFTQSFGGALIGEPRPAFNFRETDFWAHGLNIGASLTF